MKSSDILQTRSELILFSEIAAIAHRQTEPRETVVITKGGYRISMIEPYEEVKQQWLKYLESKQ